MIGRSACLSTPSLLAHIVPLQLGHLQSARSVQPPIRAEGCNASWVLTDPGAVQRRQLEWQTDLARAGTGRIHAVVGDSSRCISTWCQDCFHVHKHLA